LNSATYAEPDESSYWGSGPDDKPPFKEARLKSNDLSRKDFDNKIMDGQVFVVEDVGHDWPMAEWDCDYFKKDASFSKAEMSQQYAANGGGGSVEMGSSWLDTRSASGAADQEAPKVAPFYWGIKDIQYGEGSRTWKKSMLKKVRKNLRLPPFMHIQNLGSFNRTPEFWFAGPGAGAKAHMDSHIQATISLQLAGTKRWRLAFMEPRKTAFLGMIFKDGDVYKRPTPWRPFYNITLRKGEALFFPPGFIHETLNIDEGDGSCAASVTFQFDYPFAVRMYRKFLQRVRRTPDIHEAWNHIQSWATLFSRDPELKKGMDFREAKAIALSGNGVGKNFAAIDKDSDGKLTREELESKFGDHEATNAVGYHDLDEDGVVTRKEFAETYAMWAATQKAVLEETPQKYRKYQLEDMEGDFNIEDLEPRKQDKMIKLAFEAEAKIAAAASAKSEL